MRKAVGEAGAVNVNCRDTQVRQRRYDANYHARQGVRQVRSDANCRGT